MKLVFHLCPPNKITMKTLENSKKVSVEIKQHDLIHGEFSPEDGLEIITHLIQEKINFHNMRSLRKCPSGWNRGSRLIEAYRTTQKHQGGNTETCLQGQRRR